MLCLILLLERPVHAAEPEYQVKAAMLANFALFVEWPATAYSAPDSPFVACVIGPDPFGPYLKTELGERIGSHPTQVRELRTPQEAHGCHLVFISKSEQSSVDQVLGQLRVGSALIVSDVRDTGQFCRKGGMIALKTEGGKVRFDLNADAAAKSGLKINSKLKRLARSTDCGEGR
ncbi:YfiR family protein [Geomonas sp. RF6]|uniref:YfiR family protein n=1 Tax=Geomonas sp. RF6 TaxID=2897342 RepID=UPI001E65443B|nr:YfiR family protein [Geomonas sp. RF6]UFS69979.1 YfiR family protein [Geomonas sp. RF6]